MMATALKFAFEALYRSGAAAVLRPWTQGLGVIFCMHSVRPATVSTFSPNSNLESTPEFLDAAISMLKMQGYDLVSMDEAAQRITTGQRAAKPFAAFTLDDGYRDNLLHAMPVFRRHDCPFMVYVAPGLVDGTSELWWKALELMIDQNSRLSVRIDNETMELDTASPANKWAAWRMLLPRVQSMPEYAQRSWIRQLADHYSFDLRQLCFDEIMTWDEIREMARHPLASIGAHTINHHAVKRLTAAESFHELRGSRERLERELAGTVRHLAYPYGNVDHAGPRDFKNAAEAGFLTSTTTRLGTVFPDHKNHMQALPRVMVSGKYQQARWLQVLATGLPGRMKNRGHRLNVD